MPHTRRLSKEAHQEIVQEFSLGVKQQSLAERYHVTQSCVSKIVRRGASALNACGKRLACRSRGRPRILSSDLADILYNTSQSNPDASMSDVVSTFCKQTGQQISRTGARLYLSRFDVKLRSTVCKPELTARQRKARLEWAQKYKAWTDEEWEQVLFSDETTIEMSSNKRKGKCYRTSKQRLSAGFHRPTRKHPQKNHVMGLHGSRINW